MSFVEDQNKVGYGRLLKDTTAILFSLTGVFVDDHRKTSPENRALLKRETLDNCSKS